MRANETKEESIVENEIFNWQVSENGFQNLNAKSKNKFFQKLLIFFK